MSRKFISIIVATSIAITSISAIPAQAGNRKFNQIVVGATFLAILGAALNQNPSNARTRENIEDVPRRNRRSTGHSSRRNHHRHYAHSHRNSRHEMAHGGRSNRNATRDVCRGQGRCLTPRR